MFSDFVGRLDKSKKQLIGYHKSTKHTTILEGTIVWSWLDDESKLHRFVIPNSIYDPNGRHRLLSPQHWAKEYQIQHGTKAMSITYADKVVLSWNDDKHQTTINLGKQDNVATLPCVANKSKYQRFLDKYDQHITNKALH